MPVLGGKTQRVTLPIGQPVCSEQTELSHCKARAIGTN
jgi:hypothetical protein